MQRIARGIAVVALTGLAWWLIGLRHSLIHAVTTYDADPSEPASLPGGDGAGLPPAARVRVVLIDGLSARVAHDLPAWSALCKRGLDLRVDVGFPTVSLPVEAALWTGLTQQQTGIVYRSDVPIVPPLADSIPAKLPGSIAIAENHGYIVRSLGFHHVEPPGDDDAKAWDAAWQSHAATAIGGPAPLVFVHILRVDHVGHTDGEASEDYAKVARDADAILASFVAIDPEARWFVLSDHGHLAGGGHGGEEREVRQVEGCIAGPGVQAGRGELVHVVDIARAIADSTGVVLDKASLARPMSVAIAHPLDPEQAVVATPLRTGAIAILILLVGLVASWVMARPWWIGPWWFAIACLSVVLIRGEPTLSMRMVYAWEGRTMYLTWLPALALAAVSAYAGLARATLLRVIAGGLALPVCAMIATITVCGAWPTVVGAEIAPVVPRFTAWLSPLVLVTAHGAAAVALAVLARLVRSAFDRRSPAEPPRTVPAAG